VADITYIRLEEEFVYLAVILDAYSPRVIGWYLSDGLDDSLPLMALLRALLQRVVRRGLVHPSDRGVSMPAAIIRTCRRRTVSTSA
jgi:transposase InsO family protein